MGALTLDQIAAGQLQMYQTSNTADAQLESAMNDELTVSLASGNHTLTGPEFTRHYFFNVTGNTVSRILATPATNRFFAVHNGGSAALTVQTGSTTVTVAAGDTASFYTDGTANGLTAITGGSGASGTAGGDLTGTYPNPTIANNAVTNAKAAQMATLTIKGNNTGGTANALDLTVSQVNTMLGDELTANKGVANGYASLDSGGKVPTGQLPASVTGALVYQGSWNANTNSPTLASGVGTKGFYYKVGTAGSTAIDGISDWYVGDVIAFDGTTWDKFSGSDPEVISVCGYHGAVNLAASDLSNGTTGTGAIVLASAISGYGTGTVTTTGSPATGNLTKFSGATSITNADLSGDVATSGTLSTTIQPNVVTNAKAAQMAANTIKSNLTGSTANAADNTLSAVAAALRAYNADIYQATFAGAA